MNAIRFAKSIFWGSEGSYNLFGIQVDFLKSDDHGKQGRISQIFNAITFSHFQTFIHELGHAIPCRLYKKNPQIEIFSNSNGVTHYENTLPSRQDTVMSVAGPIFGFSFILGQLALGSIMPFPIRLILSSGAARNLTYELQAFRPETSDINEIINNLNLLNPPRNNSITFFK